MHFQDNISSFFRSSFQLSLLILPRSSNGPASGFALISHFLYAFTRLHMIFTPSLIPCLSTGMSYSCFISFNFCSAVIVCDSNAPSNRCSSYLFFLGGISLPARSSRYLKISRSSLSSPDHQVDHLLPYGYDSDYFPSYS